MIEYAHGFCHKFAFQIFLIAVPAVPADLDPAVRAVPAVPAVLDPAVPAVPAVPVPVWNLEYSRFRRFLWFLQLYAVLEPQKLHKICGSGTVKTAPEPRVLAVLTLLLGAVPCGSMWFHAIPEVPVPEICAVLAVPAVPVPAIRVVLCGSGLVPIPVWNCTNRICG